MILESLQVIGEVIAEEEVGDDPYARYYDVWPIREKEVTVVAVIRFRKDEDGLQYIGTRAVDPEDPLKMALKYGYANHYNAFDNSLTQRVSTSYLSDFKNLLKWPTSSNIGPAADEPVVVALDEALQQNEDDIRNDLERYEDQMDTNDGNQKGILTVSITDDGKEQYPGEIESFGLGARKWFINRLEKSSSVSGGSGKARCTVCDETTRVYGQGASLDKMYAVKMQWPFPNYNSSSSWRSRPLCLDCLLAVKVATDLFIKTQDYGTPGVRCRVIPYALPVDGAKEQLQRLIRGRRDELTGTGNEREQKRPISAAWEAYRGPVELDLEDDVLRLAFAHYVRDSNKAHGVAWIDGVSADQLDELKTIAENVLNKSPVFKQKLLPEPDAPTENQIFTGMWLFGLLTERIDSNHKGESTGDDSRWAEYTERLLTDGTILHDAVVGSVVREARARWRARLEQENDYPYDGFHIANAYTFLRTCAERGVLRDTRTEPTMKTELLDGDYTSFGVGLEEFIAAHPSIATSPGRKAGFVLGAAAAQLSNWQIRRKLNRTFVQNRDVAQLTTGRLAQWQTAIWEKAKTYNAQAGNYGVPWADAESLFHEAVLTGENEGWNATNDEIRYHYILGVNVGPNIARRARENRDDNPESLKSATDTEQTAEAATPQ